jgi:hypothetical protein
MRGLLFADHVMAPVFNEKSVHSGGFSPWTLSPWHNQVIRFAGGVSGQVK